MTRLWVVRGGKKGEFEQTALTTNKMALGWDRVGDLSSFKDRASVLRRVKEAYPDSSDGRLRRWAGQLYKFATDITAGDLVIMPSREKKSIFIGTVKGEYFFDPDPDSEFRHLRLVEWKKDPVPRDIFEQDLLGSFDSQGTVFEVKAKKALARMHAVIENGSDPGSHEDDKRFDWIPFYEAVADALLVFRDKRKELLEGIFAIKSSMDKDSIPFTNLEDIYPDGSNGPLRDICPFTAMGILSRGIKDDNRKIIASALREFLDIEEPVPEFWDGIPSLHNMRSWFFDYEKERQSDDIETLWEIFDRAISYAKSEDADSRSAFAIAYNKVIKVKGVSWNLSMGLYWIRPWIFASLDQRSRDYIEKELPVEVPTVTPEAENYLKILDTLKALFLKDECTVNSFPDLSLAAWLSGSNDLEETETKVQPATNLILYGPPGTGKTWKLKKLTEKYFSKEQTPNKKAWLVRELSEARWFDVIFGALYDLESKAEISAILQHDYIQTKANISNNKFIRPKIRQQLYMHTRKSSKAVQTKDRTPPLVFDKNRDGTWSLVDDWEEECQEQIELVKRWKDGPDQGSSDRRFEFVTFHQAYGYEDFVEGIKPVSPDEETGSIRFDVASGVFKLICQKAKLDPRQRYAIFIDEINRGNITSIFGELITLLEADKRVVYGEDGLPKSGTGMTLILPFSGEEFGIPANLDVYGAMNTADRSIALLDTALRRRFQFEELMPDVSVIKGSLGDGRIEDGKGSTINLRALLEAINRRIRFLLSRDMTIGHSYFINVRNFSELKDVLFSRIIPLLQEYFYDDWHRIQLVFRDVEKNRKKLEPQIIRHEQLKKVEILGFDHVDFEDSIEYRVAPENKITPDAIRKIYEESN